ncbi:MAG: ArsR family transcriptional regulator [Nitrospirota bacterium]
MLNKLFSSQTRVNLLSYLFEHMEEGFYIRELARIIRKDASGVKRELDNLEKMGLLTREKKGNQRYFTVNKTSPLYPEIKSLIQKTLGVHGVIRDALAKKIKGITKAFIYGSVAKGSDRRLGTIDLMIVGRPDLTELNGIILSLEEGFKREINYTVFDDDEYIKRKEKGDPFLSEILSGKKLMLIGREDEL